LLAMDGTNDFSSTPIHCPPVSIGPTPRDKPSITTLRSHR
jgi:hypothetical protein